MQDRYAGDLGDFLKFGLLRQLCAGDDNGAALRLGVVWYLVRDESHNDDGKHTAYLRADSRHAVYLRSLDRQLYDQLAGVVHSGERSTAALEAAGVLPPGTKTFGRPLDFSPLAARSQSDRLSYRKAWIVDALAATAGCDLVFADPDNGIRRSSHSTSRTRTKAVKHAYLDELAEFAARGQSLVIYHHADRSLTVPEQATRRLADLADEVPGVAPLAAVRASRGTTRLFLVAAAPRHLGHLTSRLSGLASSAWSKEFAVYWWNEAALGE
ncbi:MAG TPA: hypothetical protein VNF75_02400 [Candidatus Dormibacteraeota bacterium]|nr:hypothetical protein [Candidatus Dormibacteraeota bacterium]